MYTDVSLCLYIYIHTYIYVCVYVNMLTMIIHVCIYIHIYIYICAELYIYVCVCIQVFSNSIACSGKTNAGSMHVLKFLTYPDDKLWVTHKPGCQQYEPKKGYCTENWQLFVVQQQAEV